MGCPCKNKNKVQQTEAQAKPEELREPERNESPDRNAPEVTFQAVVRADGVPLACPRCLEKHLCKALVYAAEAQEDDRPIERGLCDANLMCAEEHARALGDERADRIAALSKEPHTPDAIRALLPGNGDERERAIGFLGTAEDALRFAGDSVSADRVREIRVSIQNAEPGLPAGQK